jgi:hypothetical protein
MVFGIAKMLGGALLGKSGELLPGKRLNPAKAATDRSTLSKIGGGIKSAYGVTSKINKAIENPAEAIMEKIKKGRKKPAPKETP